MTHSPRFELISFDICPYVQRSVITLKHKKVDFKLTLIDLQSPPEWFGPMSPLGKVPLLLVREDGQTQPTVLFESAVINEYLDEITPPSLQPRDPLARARERAWIAVNGDLMMNMYTMTTADDPAEAKEAATDLWDTLTQLESTLPGGKCFAPGGFSLVDAAYAPMFMRMLMMKSIRDASPWKSLPKTRRWAEALLELPEVRDSVAPDFRERYRGYLAARHPAAAADIL